MNMGLMEELRNKFEGKKALMVGLGLQGGGVGLIRFFCNLGSHVTVTDLKSNIELSDTIDNLKDLNITYSLNGHKLKDFLNADIIFKGPSVPWDLDHLKQAENKGIPIEMEVSFTASYLKSKIIGVTGTRGKTTTTEMICSFLKKTDKKIHKAGNISGVSTIKLLETAEKDDLVVLELSSWALSGFHKKKISPHIAVFTNLFPDHLNYYKTMEDYFYDKSAIFLYQNQSDYLFLNKNLKETVSRLEIKSKKIFFDKDDFDQDFKYLKGNHNKENAAVAYLVSQLFKIDNMIALKTLQGFKSVQYRQELIKQIGVISFINDSTSTTPTSTIKAVEAFNDKAVVLILGGQTKKLPIKFLLEKMSSIEFIVLLKGSFTDEIYQELKTKYKNKMSPIFNNLNEAVKFAYIKTLGLQKECYVIFSPGATSFAMFKNEFDRGNKFNEYVERL
ncbi:MAG: UDP-N-acetylmuramoyl-L-alanine--D-glutamate ligase [bacterium]